MRFKVTALDFEEKFVLFSKWGKWVKCWNLILGFKDLLTTDETSQQSGKQDSFRQVLKS